MKSSAPLQSFKQDLLDPGKAWRGDRSFTILSLNFRLQREEEEAFASSQSSQGAQSLTFSKFEEKKTTEKTLKVTTVK